MNEFISERKRKYKSYILLFYRIHILSFFLSLILKKIYRERNTKNPIRVTYKHNKEYVLEMFV